MRLTLTSSPYRWLFWPCALAVLVLALLPPSPELPTTGWDKSNHMLAFSVMGVLALRAWPGRTWVVLAGLVGYGVLIEVLQGMTPYRDADGIDVLADSIGLLLGLGVNLVLARLWPAAAGATAGKASR